MYQPQQPYHLTILFPFDGEFKNLILFKGLIGVLQIDVFSNPLFSGWYAFRGHPCNRGLGSKPQHIGYVIVRVPS